MNHEKLWDTLKAILGILKRSGIGAVPPDTLIMFMDQLEQGQNIIALPPAQEKP